MYYDPSEPVSAGAQIPFGTIGNFITGLANGSFTQSDDRVSQCPQIISRRDCPAKPKGYLVFKMNWRLPEPYVYHLLGLIFYILLFRHDNLYHRSSRTVSITASQG